MKKITLIALFILIYSPATAAKSTQAYYSYPVSAGKSAYKMISESEITSDMKVAESASSKWGDSYITYIHSKCTQYQWDSGIGYTSSYLCTRCENGYKIVYSEQTCAPECSEGCSSCLSPGVCSACASGYIMSESQCVKSTIKNGCPAGLTLSVDKCCCIK